MNHKNAAQYTPQETRNEDAIYQTLWPKLMHYFPLWLMHHELHHLNPVNKRIMIITETRRMFKKGQCQKRADARMFSFQIGPITSLIFLFLGMKLMNHLFQTHKITRLREVDRSTRIRSVSLSLGPIERKKPYSYPKSCVQEQISNYRSQL